MDVGFYSIDSYNRSLQFVGANIHLIHSNNGKTERRIGDNQPVGIFIEEKHFVTQSKSYNDDDFFYLSSDGYMDQFGGIHENKFGSKRLIQTIKKHHSEFPTKQNKALEYAVYIWKGNQ